MGTRNARLALAANTGYTSVSGSKNVVLLLLSFGLIFAIGVIISKGNFANRKPRSYHQRYISYSSRQEKQKLTYIESHLEEFKQTDPVLIDYTRIKFFTPPYVNNSMKQPMFNRTGNKSKENDPHLRYRTEFSEFVAKMFRNKTGGTFVEAGYGNSEGPSDTIYLEKKLGWKGLLIECNPKSAINLKFIQRKVWVTDLCLSGGDTPGIAKFAVPLQLTPNNTVQRESTLVPLDEPFDTEAWEVFQVRTMPLYTIMAAHGWTTLDFLRLDIGPVGLKVLRDFPFHLAKFRVIVANRATGCLEKLLGKNGYSLFKIGSKGQNKIFVHKTVKHLVPKQPKKIDMYVVN